MRKNLSRREFLKLTSLLPLTYLLPGCQRQSSKPNPDPNAPNILIIVFDAWSATNNSIYGYPRETTPKIIQLAEKGIVFHNHYTGGPFTTPGTASLLTGVLPWTHRAFNQKSGVASSFIHKNTFSIFDDYYRIAYTHNVFADVFLFQFEDSIEEHIPIGKLYFPEDWLAGQLLKRDLDVAQLARMQVLDSHWKSTANSLYFTQLHKEFVVKERQRILESYIDLYPRGLPLWYNVYFLLEDGINWVGNGMSELPQPFIGYFHFIPPHQPYKTRKEFIDIFNDDWEPIDKPEHLFVMEQKKEKILWERRMYDEYIALVDSEFDRLMGILESTGILENTWVILTSDHGEMFERGILYHSNKTLYEPLVKIPLVIFPPGQNDRVDIYSRSSAIDILPTILHAANKEIPDYLDGLVLPPLSKTEKFEQRAVFVNSFRDNPQFGPANQGTLNIYREEYKLMYFFGYEELPNNEPLIELYNLENDPEEMDNLYTSKKSIADELLDELISTLKKEEEPYSK